MFKKKLLKNHKVDHRKLSLFIHAYGIAFLFRSGKNPGGYSNFLAHLSRRLIGELIEYRSSRRPCVRPCVRPSVRPFTFSNLNFSATSWLIIMKFYLKHHWGWGKASVGFDPDRIRTLVSMATDSSQRVILGKTASSCFLERFKSDPFHTCR